MQSSIFLEGLKTAREIVTKKGIESLDRLIEEHENNTIETTAVNPEMETREIKTIYGNLAAGTPNS